MEDDKEYEYCALCENEVLIAADQVSRCPECGQRIYPCGSCLINHNSERCNWDSVTGSCNQFPLTVECVGLDE